MLRLLPNQSQDILLSLQVTIPLFHLSQLLLQQLVPLLLLGEFVLLS